MKLQGKPFVMALAVIAVISTINIPVASADEALIAEGKEVSLDRKKGNCLTCHQMAGGTLAGNIGPPLIAMKARYPDKAKLRADIWDMTKRSPHTMMPPFGKHGVLTESEIDAVTEYVHSL